MAKIFTDKVTGKLAARPELDKALACLREGDVFVITRLSRAMRLLKHLLALADELRSRPACSSRHAARDTRSSTRHSRRHRAVRSAIFMHSACPACSVQQSAGADQVSPKGAMGLGRAGSFPSGR